MHRKSPRSEHVCQEIQVEKLFFFTYDLEREITFSCQNIFLFPL